MSILAIENIEMGKIYSHNNNKQTHKIRLFIQDQIITGKKLSITIFPWLKISQLKQQIENKHLIPNVTQYNLRLFYKNIQLVNNKLNIEDFNIQADSVIVAKIKDQIDVIKGIVNPYKLFDVVPKQVTQLILKVIDGLGSGSKPKLTTDGTSGTYILENSQKKHIAIFKPYDQQPYAPNNPRNYVGKLGSEGIRKGILSGQSATRQVAAYILSSDTSTNPLYKNYHSVPVTTYIQFYHPSFSVQQLLKLSPIASGKQGSIPMDVTLTKHGSLQQFIESNDIAGNLSANLFTIQQVHKIGILDLRILNCDRNQANILVKKLINKKQINLKSNIFYELIPIDHGLSFPDNFQIYQHQLIWMNYPQSKLPFTSSQLTFIQAINPQLDAQKLNSKLGFRPLCLRNFRIAEIFLKKTAKAGFTLYQIGNILYRKSDQDSDQQQQPNRISGVKKNNRSELQNIVIQAQYLYNLVEQNELVLKNSQVSIQKVIESSQAAQDQIENIIINNDSSSQDIEKDYQQEESQISSDCSNQDQLIQQSKIIDIQNHVHSNDTTNTKDSLDNKQNIIKDIQSKKKRQTTSNIAQQPQSKKKIKRNISLPQLKKKTTSYRENKYNQRRKVQGPNGVNKSHKRNHQIQEWNQLFFHYFQELLDRYILEKKIKKKN